MFHRWQKCKQCFHVSVVLLMVEAPLDTETIGTVSSEYQQLHMKVAPRG